MPPVDTSRALNLRLTHNLTYQEIGKILGTTKQAIHNKIGHLIPTEITQDYIANRANIFAQAQLRLLSYLTDEKLKKMQARDIIVSMGILYDKERLERGQTTENIGVISATIRQLQALQIGENSATNDIK